MTARLAEGADRCSSQNKTDKKRKRKSNSLKTTSVQEMVQHHLPEIWEKFTTRPHKQRTNVTIRNYNIKGGIRRQGHTWIQLIWDWGVVHKNAFGEGYPILRCDQTQILQIRPILLGGAELRERKQEKNPMQLDKLSQGDYHLTQSRYKFWKHHITHKIDQNLKMKQWWSCYFWVNYFKKKRWFTTKRKWNHIIYIAIHLLVLNWLYFPLPYPHVGDRRGKKPRVWRREK